MDNLPDLSPELIWAIAQDEVPDELVHQLVWRALGYRYDTAQQTWDSSAVAPDWRSPYPEPPNFIDSRPATVQLTRSIPKADKQLLKEKLNFQGYSVGQLVPRLTRRATMANWLLSHLNQQGKLP